MSAERLREAARVLRERAEAATPGPWDCWTVEDDGRREVYVPDGTMGAETVLEFKDYADCEECIRPTEADTFYLSLMHPGVGLALADWLDREANSAAAGMSIGARYPSMVVADQILGGALRTVRTHWVAITSPLWVAGGDA